jgi:hypothetical protein
LEKSGKVWKAGFYPTRATAEIQAARGSQLMCSMAGHGRAAVDG